MTGNCGVLRTWGEQNMAVPIPFLPNRFRAAASHYTAGRPPYPPRLIERVALLTGFDRTRRVLDLGCGPGQLARAFATRAAEVLAVDPEPEMLRLARQGATGLPIRFLQASSYDLGPMLGRFHLAVMGRSFHWMDRPETLRRLDTLIDPGGAVVLFGDCHPDLPDNVWRPAWRAALANFRDPEREHHRAGWVRHEALLLDSAFNCLDVVAAIDRRHVPLAQLAERALSMSSINRGRSEEEMAAVAASVAEALAPFAVRGMITEIVESHALIATRPDVP
jgi:SAM-dependent methyltransferase